VATGQYRQDYRSFGRKARREMIREEVVEHSLQNRTVMMAWPHLLLKELAMIT
jgi:hypothetical protein